MVEFRPAEHLAHAWKTICAPSATGELSVTPDGISLLIDGTQLLERIVNAHRAKHELPAIDDVLDRISDSLPRADDGPARGEPRPGDATAEATERSAEPPALEMLVRSDSRAARSRASASMPSGGGSSEIGTIVEASPIVLPDASISFTFMVEVDAERGPRGRTAGRSSYGRNRPERASRRRTRPQPRRRWSSKAAPRSVCAVTRRPGRSRPGSTS